jgi:RNA polymerase sigma factor (sigma-70 family)
VEDILQEAALQAWLHLADLREAAQFGSWLVGITLNVARHALRRSSYASVAWEALWGGRLVNEPIDDAPGPEELAETIELSQRVRAAVAELPRGQREAVLLVYLGGLSYRDTAAALGIEVGAVKTRLHKGRGSLERRLRDLWKENVMSISSTSTTSTEPQMVPMRVTDVRRRTGQDGAPDRSVVVLEEVDGSRQLRFWVGRWEGDSIAMLLENVKVPRPLTHAFTASLLRAAGVRVRHVGIHRLAEQTFYAEVVLEATSGPASVDARPSDSVALALELGSPIYVASDVLAIVDAQQTADEPALETIGRSDIVAQLIENWPGPGKPSR